MTKVIMNNNVKEYVNSKGLSVSKEVYEASNKKFLDLLDAGVERALANGRKTLQNKDL